jgi:antitoxin VapB
LPKDDPWSPLVSSLEQFSDDFMDTRDQPSQEPRKNL